MKPNPSQPKSEPAHPLAAYAIGIGIDWGDQHHAIARVERPGTALWSETRISTVHPMMQHT